MGIARTATVGALAYTARRGIGMSRGLDVVSNIFGDTMQNVGLDFCESGKSVMDKKSCYQLVKLATLLNPEKQDITEKCTLLGEAKKVQECMVMRMVLVVPHFSLLSSSQFRDLVWRSDCFIYMRVNSVIGARVMVKPK